MLFGSKMKGKRGGRKKSDSFDTEEWCEEVEEAADGDHYHPGDEGLLKSLLKDVGEMVKGCVGEVKEAGSVVDDAADTIEETANDASGVAVEGGSKVKDAAEAAYREGGDDVGDKKANEAEAANDTTADVVSDVRALIIKLLIYEVVKEVAEEVLDVIPGYGLCIGAWRLAWGSAYAASGAASVATGAAVGVVGAVAGAAASPWDRGQLFRGSLKVAASSAGWGVSVLGQGTFGFVRGTCNVVGQTPGTQFVTMPVAFLAKKASKVCRDARGPKTTWSTIKGKMRGARKETASKRRGGLKRWRRRSMETLNDVGEMVEDASSYVADAVGAVDTVGETTKDEPALS